MFDNQINFLTPDRVKFGYEINGKHDFFIEPSIRGKLPYQNTSMTITCFEDDTKKRPQDFTCKWFKEHEGRIYQVEEDGNSWTYHVTPYDISKKIKCLVKASERKKGWAEVSFGPIKPDPTLVSQMENNLLFGVGDMKIDIQRVGNKMVDWGETVDSTLSVNFKGFDIKFGGFQDNLSFKFNSKDFVSKGNAPQDILNNDYQASSKQDPNYHNFTKGSFNPYNNTEQLHQYEGSEGLVLRERLDSDEKESREMEIEFARNNLENPEQVKTKNTPIQGIDIICPHNDPNAIEIVFDYEQTEIKRIFQCEIDEGAIQFRFESRFYRDNFLLTYMMSKALRFLSISILSNQLEKILRDERPLSILQVDTLEEQKLLTMENLRRGLESMIGINVDQLQDNKSLGKSVDILEEDICFLIKEFNGLLEKVKKDECFKLKNNEQEKYFQDLSKNIMNRTPNDPQLVKSDRPNNNAYAFTGGSNPNKIKTTESNGVANSESSEEKITRLEKELNNTKKQNQLLMRELETQKKIKQDNVLVPIDGNGIKRTNSVEFDNNNPFHIEDSKDKEKNRIFNEGHTDENILADQIEDLEDKVNNTQNNNAFIALNNEHSHILQKPSMNLLTDKEREFIKVELVRKVEEKYGEYARELQGKNIGLVHQLDKTKGKLEKIRGRFDEFRVLIYDLVTKQSVDPSKEGTYQQIISDFCKREGVAPNLELFGDLNNIEIVENWLVLLDRIELLGRAEELKTELTLIQNEDEFKYKRLVLHEQEDINKKLRIENFLMAEEVEKYKELLQKQLEEYKTNQRSNIAMSRVNILGSNHNNGTSKLKNENQKRLYSKDSIALDLDLLQDLDLQHKETEEESSDFIDSGIKDLKANVDRRLSKLSEFGNYKQSDNDGDDAFIDDENDVNKGTKEGSIKKQKSQKKIENTGTERILESFKMLEETFKSNSDIFNQLIKEDNRYENDLSQVTEEGEVKNGKGLLIELSPPVKVGKEDIDAFFINGPNLEQNKAIVEFGAGISNINIEINKCHQGQAQEKEPHENGEIQPKEQEKEEQQETEAPEESPDKNIKNQNISEFMEIDKKDYESPSIN